jgi:hypothetical protein
MDVGRSVLYRERNARRVYHEMALGALFAAIGRIRPSPFAPPGAGIAAESSEALDQSMRSPPAPLSAAPQCLSELASPAC